MASIAGKVAPVPKGAWDSTTAYEKLNIVSHNGYVYMAKSDNTGHEPVSGASDTYWMLLVSGGVVSVDSAMSPTSTNPVQNKVIGTALDTAKDEAQEVVTDQYNSATNYGVMGNASGYPSFCISGDVLYKCKSACVGVAPPNVTYWEATDVGTEISTLNSVVKEALATGLYGVKYGKVRAINLTSYSFNATDKISLGSDYIPKNDVYSFALGYTSSTAELVRLNINMNGQMYVTNSAGTQIAANYIVASVTYIAA